MFTYIELVNFKSFGQIRFDFKTVKKDFKKFIAIYGENGSGKSNFVSSIELLAQSINTLTSMEKFEKYREQKEEYQNNLRAIMQHLNDFISHLNNLKHSKLSEILDENRMIGADNSTIVKYGFIVDGVEGYYSIEFDSNAIIKEELYYLNNKQRGIVYSIEKCNSEITINFNDFFFKDKKYRDILMTSIKMYWGSHTFLAIMQREKQNVNKEYLIEAISGNFLKVLDALTKVYIICKHSETSITGIVMGSNIKIKDFGEIVIENNNAKKMIQLKKVEEIVKDFLMQAYTDIVDVRYEKVLNASDDLVEQDESENHVTTYTLVISKMIAGKVINVPFEFESAGTQRVLRVLRAIVEAINGQTVVYDEIDDGIHDLLMCNVLLSAQDKIEGQLIITTHNTLLLEDMNPKSAYVIYSDSDGNKEARCIDEYGIRIQASNNQRKLYLNGVFGGIPYTSEIDYSQDIYRLDDNLED